MYVKHVMPARLIKMRGKQEIQNNDNNNLSLEDRPYFMIE